MRTKLILFLTILFCNTALSLKGQGYNIDVTINGWSDTTLILGHYFNKKMLVNDTIIIDSAGKGTFKGNEPLPGGIYLMYMPDQKYFDVLIDDEQHFSIEVEKSNPVETLEVKGNKQEKAFNEYQKYLAKQQKKAQSLQSNIKDKAETHKDSVEIWKNQLSGLSSEMKSYWDNILKEYNGKFLASFIKGIKEVEVPDFKETPALPDSVVRWKRYEFYKEHYFDNIDLTDDRMLRTPYFSNKLETFLTKTIFQIPDSIVKESEKLIEKARENKDMEKYLIQFAFNTVNESKVMGMDAAMVSLAEKYYLSGYADWVDEEFLTKLEERVTKLKPNLIGNKAPDLKLISPNNEHYRLNEVYGKLTILVFWEPDCGHCKKEIPKLKEEIWDKYSDQGVKIFAVYTQHEKEKWTDFIEEHQLEEWINVWDPYNQSNFRNLYDIYSTPAIFVINEEKNIIAKRIGAEQLPGFIDYYLKKNN
ncbi:TlpA family protein disulfide reductase [Plebeiibacterium marinum]|uniref:Redoxin domain-containing protein n=1 Tax=Plebeiibacterium marinum TaxID=2992111 RepID=A0AAE3MGQ1_9BACT|nr:TlpA family protein disulfide reductase [Plebeiobacterium marinum]MCW3807254.1 redoxin domain-containing protein [Plebeiobacterium marinum]